MTPSDDAPARPRLEVRDLGVVAGGREVLRGVCFDARAGEVVAVLGPNGSGKTTLLEAIAGLRHAARGTVSIEGRALRRFRDRATRLAFMPQDDVLPEEAPLGIALGLRPDDALVAAFELGPLLGARATEVSWGESKRAQLCATLKIGRPVVLLDEPFGAFDPRQLRALLPIFREASRDAAVVVTVHQMRTAELVAHRLVLLSGAGAIAFGTLEELRVRASAPEASLDEIFLRLLDEEAPRANA
jgi:ABC-type multidrug transport system ATPase subunit